MDHDLAVNLAKSDFHLREVNFLGYLLGTNDTLPMELDKIEATQKWEIDYQEKRGASFLWLCELLPPLHSGLHQTG